MKIKIKNNFVQVLHIIVYLTIDNESSQSIVNYNILIISFVFLDYIYGKSDLILKLKKSN